MSALLHEAAYPCFVSYTCRAWLSLLLLAFLPACGVVKVSTDCACGFYLSEAGHEMHWPEGTSINAQIHGSVPQGFRAKLSAAADPYNKLLSKIRIYDEQRKSVPNYDPSDGVNGIYFHEEPWPWEKESPKSVAITTIVFSPDGIAEADVHFRASAFPDTSEKTLNTFYMVAVHEFGHLLGRVHSEDEDSIMFPEVDPERTENPFGKIDLELFASVYSLKN